MTPLIDQTPRLIAFFIGLGMGIMLGLLIAFTAVKNIAKRRAHRHANNTREKPHGQ